MLVFNNECSLHSSQGPVSFITARKRSLRRLCFYRCLSFCPGEGTCMVAPGGRVWLLRGRGGCMVALGGMHSCSGGCAWLLLGGVCGCSGGGHAWDTTRYGDTINERAVRILLECILVQDEITHN